MQDKIERTVDIAAPPSRVWDALTDHRKFGEWFRVDLKDPFVVGKTTRGVTTYPGYEGYPWVSITRTMEREALFAFSWAHDEKDMEGTGPMTLVEFRLEATPAGTRLTITESGFSALPEDKRMEALRSNTRGWEIQAGNIKSYAES